MFQIANDGYALLIGVNDYSAFDAAQGKPRGTSDLLGSRNDVRAWWGVCRSLGIKPENIRVLTSPRIDPAELEGASSATFAEATEEEILAGVEWLAKRLGGPSGPSGLMTYSGHGDWVEGKGLAICPTDTRGANLQHAIVLDTLKSVFERAHGPRAADNLTVVLDCCHAGSAAAAPGKALSLTGRALPERYGAQASAAFGRVLSACRSRESAFQARFAGEQRGAFTWALTSALGRWQSAEDGGSRRLTVSYGEARARAQRLLDALGVPQTAAVHGPPEVEALAVFQRGLAPRPTEVAPNAPLTAQQVDPGNKDYRLITFTFSSSVNGYIIVPKVTRSYNNITYSVGSEYWYLINNIPTDGSTSLGVAWDDHYWPASDPLAGHSFTTSQTTSWTSTSAPASGNSLYVNNTSPAVCLHWNVSASWTGNLTWYSTSNSNIFSGAASSRTLTAGTSPTGSTWYKATSQL